MNRVSEHREPRYKPGRSKKKPSKDDKCYRCGNFGHYGRDPKCPAKGKTCKKCTGKNHFARMCRTKQSQEGKINQVEEQELNAEYAFQVSGKETATTLNVSVGGVDVEFLVDSGSSCNIIDEETWEMLKAKRIKCESTTTLPSKQLFSYASKEPLSIKGSFRCETKVGKGTVSAAFYVIKGKGVPLLGRETATELGH